VLFVAFCGETARERERFEGINGRLFSLFGDDIHFHLPWARR
jgi:hypothetical protein